MEHSSLSASQTHQPVQQNSLSLTQADVVGSAIAGLLVILLPSCLVLGAVLYRKRKSSHAYHMAVRLRQIQTLERMWQISPKQ